MTITDPEVSKRIQAEIEGNKKAYQESGGQRRTRLEVGVLVCKRCKQQMGINGATYSRKQGHVNCPGRPPTFYRPEFLDEHVPEKKP